METGHKSTLSQPAHHHPPLQDGGGTSDKRPVEGERLDGKAGSQRRLSLSPNGVPPSEISQIQVEPADTEFSSLPLGLSSAPYAFTKLLKPMLALLRSLGTRCILYLDDMLIMAQSKESLQTQLATTIELLISLGFIVNMKKSAFKPTQEITGFPAQFPIHDHCTTSQENPPNSPHGAQDPTRGTDLNEKVSTTVGLMVAAHPAVLPAPIYYRWLERQKIKTVRLQGYNSSLILEPQTKMEQSWWLNSLDQHNGRNLQITHWDMVIETDASTRGWGGKLRRSEYRGPLDQGGKSEPHKLPGATSSLLSSKNICFKNQFKSNPPLTGQYHGHVLRLLNTLRFSRGNMEVVPAEKNHYSHRTPTRQGERQGRLGISSSEGLKQLETPQGSIFSVGGEVGPLYCGSVRIEDEHSTADILQLETGSESPSSRCPVDVVEEASTVHVPSLLPDKQVSGESQSGESGCSANCTCLVWFPRILENLRDDPILLPETHDIVKNTEGNDHPLALQGHLPLAVWPISGRHSA